VIQGAAVYGQPKVDSLLSGIDPHKLSASIEKELSRVERKVISKSEDILKLLQKEEERIYEKRLGAKDLSEAKAKLADVQSKYTALAEKLRNSSSVIASNARQYIPRLDTMSSVLKFFEQNNAMANLKGTISKIESFNEKLQQAQEINDFICERREMLQHELGRLHLVKELRRFNKKTYYYHEQVKEYKAMVNDPGKMERKVIGLLIKTKAFRDFMRKNSLLASLFRMPRDPDDPVFLAGLAGLQTRVEVNNLIAQQFASGALNAQARFQENVRQAGAQLNQLKEKLLKASSNGEGLVGADDIIPGGFKPNNQKTRPLLKRLEYGANIQAQRATNFFPATTDLGLSVGYKLNDKSIIGVGASYKAGLGGGWNHMELSSQGAGLRSFADLKLKGSIWISGGYEMNYKSQLRGVQISSPFVGGHEATAWQQSGLIGLSKVMDVKSKFFKKTKLQLLWDFLSYQQVPRTQPVIFRIGYHLK
jgi:hypothetical protein